MLTHTPTSSMSGLDFNLGPEMLPELRYLCHREEWMLVLKRCVCVKTAGTSNLELLQILNYFGL